MTNEPIADGRGDDTRADGTHSRTGLRAMRGRAGDEFGRGASSTELILDLTVTAAFGVAAAQLADGLADGHSWRAILAFCAAVLAIVLAWTNYTWFASAFDTDDWLYRFLTYLQTGGVIVMAIGIPGMYDAVYEGHSFTNVALVGGYVLMRVALVAQWIRAAIGSRYTKVAVLHALLITAAQVGWVILAITTQSLLAALLVAALLWLVEFAGPFVANHLGHRWHSTAPPWHAGHIADRYSTLTMISLGETVVGTLAAASIISGNGHWTIETGATIALGTALTFSLWSMYQALPSSRDVLNRHRRRSGPWTWVHIPIFMSVAGVGAGLHVLGYTYEHQNAATVHLSVVALAVPVLVFTLACFCLRAIIADDNRDRRALLAITLWGIALPILGMLVARGASDAPLWIGQVIVLAGPIGLLLGNSVVVRMRKSRAAQ